MLPDEQIRALAEKYSKLSGFYGMLSKPLSLEIIVLTEHPQKFYDLVWELKKNPSTVHYHLQKLLEYGLVEKVGKLYRNTEIGKAVLTEDVVRLTQIASLL
jgi:predicted transcriptional regulator